MAPSAAGQSLAGWPRLCSSEDVPRRRPARSVSRSWKFRGFPEFGASARASVVRPQSGSGADRRNPAEICRAARTRGAQACQCAPAELRRLGGRWRTPSLTGSAVSASSRGSWSQVRRGLSARNLVVRCISGLSTGCAAFVYAGPRRPQVPFDVPRLDLCRAKVRLSKPWTDPR